MGCAAALHALFRNSDLYFMANYAQTVNIIGAIKTTGTDAWLETTGQVLKLYRHHFGTIPVALEGNVKGLTAAWTEDRSVLTFAAVNTTNTTKTILLEADGLTLSESVSGWMIHHDDPDAYNDENKQDNVIIQDISLAITNSSVDLKPCRLTVLAIPSKN